MFTRICFFYFILFLINLLLQKYIYIHIMYISWKNFTREKNKWKFIFFLINIYYFIPQFFTISNISQNKKFIFFKYLLLYFTIILRWFILQFYESRKFFFLTNILSFCSTVIYTIHVKIFIWPRYNIPYYISKKKKLFETGNLLCYSINDNLIMLKIN